MRTIRGIVVFLAPTSTQLFCVGGPRSVEEFYGVLAKIVSAGHYLGISKWQVVRWAGKMEYVCVHRVYGVVWGAGRALDASAS